MNASGQELPPCGTSLLMESSTGNDYYPEVNAIIENYQSEKSDRSTLVIPIVFHLIYNTTEQNIDDSLIHQQIQRLNLDFQKLNADTINTPEAFKPFTGSMDIEFCLARISPEGDITNGILRIATDETIFPSATSYDVPDPVKHTITGGSDAWNTSDYMNIWICNLTGSTAYTAPPGNFVDPADDGIVCHYNHIGNSGVAPYDLGRSIVHEMAHWLGLKHIWGDDGGTCEGTDYMADTPNQANWTAGCPDFPLLDACTPDGAGVMYMNYMDYSRDDCRNMFSIAQVLYMQSFYDAIMPTYYTIDKCTVDDAGIPSEYEKAVVTFFNETLTVKSNAMISTFNIYNLNGQLLETSNVMGSEHSVAIQYTGMFILEIIYESDRPGERVKFIMN